MMIRGPKRTQEVLYLLCVLVPSTIYSFPHFFEHQEFHDSNGTVHLMKVHTIRKIHFPNPKTLPAFNKDFAFYWKLCYYTILDGLLKLFIPAAILIYTNISIYKLIGRDSSMVVRDNISKFIYQSIFILLNVFTRQ